MAATAVMVVAATVGDDRDSGGNSSNRSEGLQQPKHGTDGDGGPVSILRNAAMVLRAESAVTAIMAGTVVTVAAPGNKVEGKDSGQQRWQGEKATAAATGSGINSGSDHGSNFSVLLVHYLCCNKNEK